MGKRSGRGQGAASAPTPPSLQSEEAGRPAKKAKAVAEKGPAKGKGNKKEKEKEEETTEWDGTRLLHFLGPEGTYSHQVARELHPLVQDRRDKSPVKLVPVNSIAETAVRAAERTQATGEISYALLPYENNINGPVHESYDFLYGLESMDKVGFAIVEEYYLTVNHCLMCTKQTYAELTKGFPGKPQLDRIKVLSSHWQALGQCSAFIEECLSKPELKQTQSTGEAATTLQEYHEKGEHFAACISSKVCAESDVYDLVILAEEIQNSTDNTTRFLLLECAQTVEIPEDDAGGFAGEVKSIVTRLKRTIDVQGYCWRMLLRMNAPTSFRSFDNISLVLKQFTCWNQSSRIRTIDRRHIKDMPPGEISSYDSHGDKHEALERASQGDWPWTYLIEIQMRYTREDCDDSVRSDSLDPDSDECEPSVRLLEIFTALFDHHLGTTTLAEMFCLGIWPVRLDEPAERQHFAADSESVGDNDERA